MKTLTKIGFAALTFIAAASFTSCSVEYRTRHPRHEVIVVGMAKPSVPVNAAAEFTQQTPAHKADIIIAKK